MSAATDLDQFDIINPASFAAHGYPHEEWTRLRRESPIHFYDNGPLPFYAITKHAHITEIGKQPDLFLNAPLLMISDRYNEETTESMGFERPRTLIEQDNPRHRASRKLISGRFTPGALRKIHADIERIAKKIVDEMTEVEAGEIDFVEKVSAPLPIAVIAWLLGVPESDWNLIFDWTNRVIGSEDPEYNQGNENDGAAAMVEMFTYFTQVVEERKKNPKDDLISVFNNAKDENGEPLPLMDVLAWCQIIMVAGNETTRNATSGGMLALIQNPDQLARVQADPTLLRSTIEECVRWSSPVIHFARTLSKDTDFHGTKFRQGDRVALYYPSANRDEDVFENPFSFDVGRSPNPHLGFGVGEHFCAGAHIARIEIEMAFKFLLPRIEEIELTGEPARLHSNLIGGIKHLPIRYKLRPE